MTFKCGHRVKRGVYQFPTSAAANPLIWCIICLLLNSRGSLSRDLSSGYNYWHRKVDGSCIRTINSIYSLKPSAVHWIAAPYSCVVIIFGPQTLIKTYAHVFIWNNKPFRHPRCGHVLKIISSKFNGTFNELEEYLKKLL